MMSVQLGSALSVHLITAVGPAGTAWLRLSMGALIFLALARPPLRAIRRRDVPALLGLGVTTGLQTIAFLAAIERIPLGTAVAIEFLGPLTVAAVRSHSTRALAAASYLISSLAPVVSWTWPARYASLFYWSVGNSQISHGVSPSSYTVLIIVGL
jgi:inner membrane transporter RhtA